MRSTRAPRAGDPTSPAARPAGARAGLLAVSGSAVLWGTTGVAVRIITERTRLSALPIGFLRLTVAGLVMALVMSLSTRSTGWRGVLAVLRRRPLLVLAAGGGLGIYQALYFLGIEDVGVSVSTLVSLGVAPVALTVAGALQRRRLPDRSRVLVVATALAGLALISLRAGAGVTGPHPVLGVLVSLGSGLGYAAVTVVNRRLAVDGDPLALTGVTSLVGAVVLLPIAVLPVGGQSSLRWPADVTASWWLVYIGVASTCLAYGLFYLGLRSVPTEVAGVLTLLEPLTAALVAAVVLHEHLTTLAVVGAGLLLAAVAALYVRVPLAAGGAAEPPR